MHVQFSGIGVDLAIVDSSGAVDMRCLAGALGRMVPADRDPTREVQPKNELDTIVGMHWLSLWPAEFTVRRTVPSAHFQLLISQGPLYPPREQDQRPVEGSSPTARTTCTQSTPSCRRTPCYASHKPFDRTHFTFSERGPRLDVHKHFPGINPLFG